MAEAPLTSHRRAEQNRRATRILLVVFALLVLPALAFLAVYLAVFVMMFIMPELQGEAQPTLWIAAYWATVGVLLAGIVWRVVYVRNALPSLLGAIPLRGDTAAPVYRRLENLSLAAGIQTPRLFLLRTPVSNALSTGPDQEHAAVLVTEGLLRSAGKRGLDGVLAHEVAHIANEDVRLNSTLAGIVRTVRLPAPIYWPLLVFSGISLLMLFAMPNVMNAIESLRTADLQAAVASSEGVRRWLVYLGVILHVVFAFGFVSLIALPVVGRYLQSHVARQREFLADAEAITLTRDPIGLAQALRTIAGAPVRPGAVNEERSGLPATRGWRGGRVNLRGVEHLCIAPAGRGWAVTWFPTHPALMQRVAALERMAPLGAGESTAEEADPAFAAAADAAIAAHVEPVVVVGRRPYRPFAHGMIAGVLVQTLLFGLHLFRAAGSVELAADLRLLLVGSPLGIAGAAAAYVAARRKGLNLAWPSVVMFAFGHLIPAILGMGILSAPVRASTFGILTVYLMSLTEPLAGAALGAWASKGFVRTLGESITKMTRRGA